MIPRLLHLANASPPLRKEFYALKERLLEKHGTPDGYDVQHIGGKLCYGCDGTGIWQEYGDGEYVDFCDQCGGSGWWKHPRWIVLQRYRYGEYVFHVPREFSTVRPEPDVTRIEGYIKHPDYGRKSHTAFAWLCVLCREWRLLGKWLTLSRPSGWQWNPWLIAQQVVCTVLWKWRDWQSRCRCCKRRVWKQNILICDRCCTTEDVPF